MNLLSKTLASATLILLLAAPAVAQTYNAVCTAVAGTIGGKRYATVKCYKETEPGNYSIRSKVWEYQDAKAYRDMARLSGARFTCTMTVTGSKPVDDQVYENLKVSDCRAGSPARQAKPPAAKGAAVQLAAPGKQSEPAAKQAQTTNRGRICWECNSRGTVQRACTSDPTQIALMNSYRDCKRLAAAQLAAPQKQSQSGAQQAADTRKPKTECWVCEPPLGFRPERYLKVCVGKGQPLTSVVAYTRTCRKL